MTDDNDPTKTLGSENQKDLANKMATFKKINIQSKDELTAEQKSLENLNLYVGIGASAGGLEALQEFFSELPSNTGNTYIVVQHLSPDFKSLVGDLLSRKTKMPIHTIENGQIPRSNTIYLLPPSTGLTINNGRLETKIIPAHKKHIFALDSFFQSLAQDQGQSSAAIILSGTGSDGSQGIQAINGAGGLTFVQDPESAKFDGMPHSALATGVCRKGLTPREIAQCLASPEKKLASLEIDIEEEQLHALFTSLKNYGGIDFTSYKLSTVKRQIQRRMTNLNMSSFEDYLKLVISNDAELKRLHYALLINVTRFFRDIKAFDILYKKVILNLLQQIKPEKTIRVWSLGCSTGEEAFSVAISFFNAMEELGVQRDIRIFATDADQNAIAQAGNGIYPKTIVEDVPKNDLKRYFIENEDHFVVSAQVRRSVLFARHNIAVDPPFSNIDLVICRNVLIYFVPEMQQRALSTLSFALNKGCFLFLGSSETLGNMSENYRAIHEKFRIYEKKSLAANPPQFPIVENGFAKKNIQYKDNSSQNYKNSNESERESYYDLGQDTRVLRHLLNSWVPPTILVDDAGRGIYSYGDTSLFTQQFTNGRLSNDIRSIVNESLVQIVLSALDRVKTNDVVIYRDVPLTKNKKKLDLNYNNLQDHNAEDSTSNENHETNSSTRIFDLRVESIRHSKKNNYLLTFMNVRDLNGKAESIVEPFDEIYSERRHLSNRVEELEDELFKSQEHLQITVEELETTNEELQASNEELMSANEELQSTNEELHSLNEELFTVNSEFQEKINYLSFINDDYNNILNATGLAILLLDETMTIRKFTHKISNYFNVLIKDIGRPIHHFSNELNYSELIADVSQVFESGQGVYKQVQLLKPIEFDDDGSLGPYYNDVVNLEIQPYMGIDDTTAGTVVVILRIPKLVEP